MQGYILEEVLAYLIRKTGYDLLVDPKQDQRELGWKHNGLVVKGRGGVHQVDVLGQLSWVPAFTFPLRLFIEAKFRYGTTQIQTVRNAIGVILDINQNNSPTREQKPILPKYQYVYAICSTSGFSQPAQDMAVGHQISLIDLSGTEYRNLLSAITQSAEAIVDGPSRLGQKLQGENIVISTRHILRKTLGTWPSGLESDYDSSPRDRSPTPLEESLAPAISVAREYGELFVAMVNGPYMLLMKADNPSQFVEYCKRNPRHDVQIHWEDGHSPWTINPSNNPSAYRLSFILPRKISAWIFESARDASDSRVRAFSVKRRILSSVTIVRREEDRDHLFRLEFDPESVPVLPY